MRLIFDAEGEPEEKARLSLLSEILTTVPLTARAHRELNPLRRSQITGQALIKQLLRIVRDYNLEEAHRAIADRAKEAPLIPRIICSEVLMCWLIQDRTLPRNHAARGRSAELGRC